MTSSQVNVRPFVVCPRGNLLVSEKRNFHLFGNLFESASETDRVKQMSIEMGNCDGVAFIGHFLDWGGVDR